MFRNVVLKQSKTKMVNVHFYHTVPQQLLPLSSLIFSFLIYVQTETYSMSKLRPTHFRNESTVNKY